MQQFFIKNDYLSLQKKLSILSSQLDFMREKKKKVIESCIINLLRFSFKCLHLFVLPSLIIIDYFAIMEVHVIAYFVHTLHFNLFLIF